MKALLVLALAGCTSVACGPPDFELINTCGPMGGFADVRSQEPTPGLCDTADAAINLSRAILTRSGFTNDGELNTVRGGLTLGVLSTVRFAVGNSPELGGISYHGEIAVGSSMWSTLHEEIHEVRMSRGIPESQEANHVDWDSTGFGYVALTDLFVFDWLGIRVCNAQEPLDAAQLAGLKVDASLNVADWLTTPCAE